MLKKSLSGTPGKFLKKEAAVLHSFDRTRQGAVQRFPLVFTLLGAFGLVATFYGFEGIIDSIAVLEGHPVILLAIGVVTLALTGSLYKKLG